jgi:hypothetical protein
MQRLIKIQLAIFPEVSPRIDLVALYSWHRGLKIPPIVLSFFPAFSGGWRKRQAHSEKLSMSRLPIFLRDALCDPTRPKDQVFDVK